MLRFAQSCSCSSSFSFSIFNRHQYGPSDLGEEGERSRCSDFFGSHAPVENGRFRRLLQAFGRFHEEPSQTLKQRRSDLLPSAQNWH
jgi:hypothetical protein